MVRSRWFSLTLVALLLVVGMACGGKQSREPAPSPVGPAPRPALPASGDQLGGVPANEQPKPSTRPPVRVRVQELVYVVRLNTPDLAAEQDRLKLITDHFAAQLTPLEGTAQPRPEPPRDLLIMVPRAQAVELVNALGRGRHIELTTRPYFTDHEEHLLRVEVHLQETRLNELPPQPQPR